MLNLVIPKELKQEFATIEAIWVSRATTRRVDSLLLAWVKYEKQLRRLFCFLVFQHPRILGSDITSVINAMAQRNNLHPHTFVNAIAHLGVTPVSNLIGPKFKTLNTEVNRIKRYRNKLMHGQVTGLPITSRQLEVDVGHLIDWIQSLAIGADGILGYDGLRRNTFKEAKASAKINVANYPFATANQFGAWLATV